MGEGSSLGSLIMELLHEKFSSYLVWDAIEIELATLCSNIPEVTSEKKKSEVIKALKKIKKTLIIHKIKEEDLDFIDEEIERYQYTKQISLYVEKDEELNPTLIKRYAKVSLGTEGVMAIHLPLNYGQLKKLTNGVFNETGLIKFYISKEKTIYGKIVAEVYDHPQMIPIAKLVATKKKVKETGEPLFKKIFLFGEKVPKNEYNLLKEIELPFRVYRFITEDRRKDMILLTPEELDVGDYILTGVMTQIDDYKALTDSAKLPTKLPYFFAQDVRNRIISYKNHDEFRKRLALLNISKPNLFDYPFAIKIKKLKKTYIMNHPKWFKWFIWAWLLHSEHGIVNEWPFHIIMIGPTQSGKSVLVNGLHLKSKESLKVFSGVSSTLKHLVPSFKYTPARMGYLAESNRFAFCDEFLRCLIRTRTSIKDGSARDESVGIMNDLLEHQKREAGSGISKIANLNMTARTIATSNPIRGIKTVSDLIRAYDPSFMSRWVVYRQKDEHFRMVRDSKLSDLKEYNFNITVNDWISLVDYLHTFTCKYDEDRVETILKQIIPVLNTDLKDHYDARHRHHIKCLLDGLIKTRCLFERNVSFNAQEKDYEMLEDVWTHIISSWIDADMIRTLPIKMRIRYLPEMAQFMFKKICEVKGRWHMVEFKETMMKFFTKTEMNTAYIILRDNGVIEESDGYLKPYFLEDG